MERSKLHVNENEFLNNFYLLHDACMYITIILFFYNSFSMTLANAAYASRSQIFSNTLQRPLPPNPTMELQKIDQEDEIYEHLDNDPGVKESAFKDKDFKNCELFENTYAGNDSGREGQEPPTYMEVIGGIAGGKEAVKPDGTDAAGPIDISNALSKIDDDHDYA